MPTTTNTLKLEAIDTILDKNMTGKSFIEITSGIGENNLKKIDDFANKTNVAINEIKESPTVIYIKAVKESDGIYTADVSAIKKLIRNGIYIVSLNEENTTGNVALRINGIVTVELKKNDLKLNSLINMQISDLRKNIEYIFRYDGTYFVLVSNNSLLLDGKEIEDFVLKSEVIDNFDSENTNVPPSARQVKLLNQKIDSEKSKLQSSIDLKAPISNPTFTGFVSGITNEMVGLGNLTNDLQVKKSEIGVANGVAPTDENNIIPSRFLPSYVDDVLEFDYRDVTQTNGSILEGKTYFPEIGESGKIYVDTSEDLTYRWGSTRYTEISKSLGLGETVSTAYPGDKGKKNAVDILELNNSLNTIGIVIYRHIKIENSHELSGEIEANNIKFKATADYAAGDTFAVNGIAVTAKTIDGAVLSTGDFKSGNWVEAALDGTALTFQFRSYAAELSNVLTYTPTADPPSPPLPIDADLLGGYKPEYYASAAGLAAVEGEVAGKSDKNSPEFSGTPVSNGGYYQAGSNWGVSARYGYRGTISYGTANEYGPEFDIATATPPQEYDLPLVEGYTKIYATNQCNYSKDQFGRVYGKGTIKSGVPFGINIHFANLPMGFRPAIGTEVESSATFSVAPSETFYSGRVFVNSAGMVFAATASSYGATELVFGFSFLAAPTTTQSSQVRMSMSKTRSAALPIEPIVKCMCVVDADGNYVEFVLVTISQDEEGMLYSVYGYELKDGERLADADHPTMRPHAGADGLITPRWNGTAWIEGATPDEIATWELEHPAPPTSAPTLEERNRADIDYLLIMGGLANDLV